MEITFEFCLKFELRLSITLLRRYAPTCLEAPLDTKQVSMFDRMHLRRQRNFKMCLVLARELSSKWQECPTSAYFLGHVSNAANSNLDMREAILAYFFFNPAGPRVVIFDFLIF